MVFDTCVWNSEAPLGSSAVSLPRASRYLKDEVPAAHLLKAEAAALMGLFPLLEVS